jgi:hypothetical protein
MVRAVVSSLSPATANQVLGDYADLPGEPPNAIRSGFLVADDNYLGQAERLLAASTSSRQVG